MLTRYLRVRGAVGAKSKDNAEARSSQRHAEWPTLTDHGNRFDFDQEIGARQRLHAH